MKDLSLIKYFFSWLFILSMLFPKMACSLNSDEIVIKYNLKQERELQKAVDDGHQPWRLNPIDVAHAAIISYADKDVKYEKCSLIIQEKKEAVVQCDRDKISYKIHLKKFFGKKSIWTAIKIQKIKTK